MREARYTRRKCCQICGKEFFAARSDARTCGPTCKKRLQRGSTKDILGRPLRKFDGRGRPLDAVPLIAAATKGTAKPGVDGQWGHRIKSGKWCDDPYFWKHHATVQALIMGRWHAGRINWHSKCGTECIEANNTLSPAELRESILLPVETLTEILPVFQFDVRPV